jgi:hypothetical protein
MWTPGFLFPGVLVRFSFRILRGTKIWIPQNSSSDVEEQNRAYFTWKLSILVGKKYNLNVKSYNFDFHDGKIFQNPFHPKSFSKCINSFTPSLLIITPFCLQHQRKSQENTPQNYGDPRGTKKIHSSYSSFPKEWNSVNPSPSLSQGLQLLLFHFL